MSWGNVTNLDGNTGWTWGNEDQGNTGGWDAVSDKPAVGWNLAQWGGEALASTNEPNKDEVQPVEQKAPTPLIRGWEPPLPQPAPERRWSNASASTSRRLSSSTLKYDLNVPTLKEDHEIYRASSITPTELSSVGQDSHNLRFSDPMQAFRATIRRLLQAVRHQIEYDQASALLDQWRKTRESEVYAHATPATRKRLEDQRVEIGNKQLEAQKKLKVALDALAELRSHPDSALYIIDDGEMTRFTNEMNEWLQNTGQHPAIQKQPEAQPAEEPLQRTEQESVFSKDPSQWTVDDIQNALVELDSGIDPLCELVYNDNGFQPPEELDNDISGWKTQLTEGRRQGLEALIMQGKEEQQHVEETFAASAEKVAMLVQENASLRNELDASLALLDSLDATFAQLASFVDESERAETQDKDHLAEITNMVRNMLVPENPPQLKMDTRELLPPLQDNIIPHLRDEVVPLVEQFRSMYLQHEKQTQAFADHVSNFLVRKMDVIAKAAQTQ